jgi:hypothetical protein
VQKADSGATARNGRLEIAKGIELLNVRGWPLLCPTTLLALDLTENTARQAEVTARSDAHETPLLEMPSTSSAQRADTTIHTPASRLLSHSYNCHDA